MSFADVLVWLGVTMFCGALAGWVVTRYLARRAQRKPPPNLADKKDRRTDSEIRRDALTYAQQLLTAYIDPQYDFETAIEAIPSAAHPEVLIMLTKLLGDYVMGVAGPTADPAQVTQAIAVVFDKHRAES